jgi:tetratricopeptide (TPR) repeat protein
MRTLALALGLVLVASTAFAQGRTGSGSPGQQAFEEGVRLLNSDDNAGAEQKFREAIQLDNTLVLAYGKLGAVLFAQKKYKDAVDVLKKCPDQNDLEVREQLGLNLDKMGSADAVRILEGVVKEKPEAFASQLVLGLHYFRTKEYKRAPAAFEAYLKNRPAAAAQLDNDIRYKLANAYLLSSDWDAAQREFESLLKIKPNDLGYKLGLGTAYVAKEECGKAITLYERILGEATKQPSIYYNLGKCYQLERRYTDAEREANLYTRAKTTEAKGFILLGDAQYEQGKYSPALAAYQQARNIDKNNPQIIAKIGRTDVKLKNYDAAIAELETVEKASPNDVDVLCAEIEAFAAKKVKDKLNEKADKLAPLTKDAKALKCAAVAYVTNGNDEKAKVTLEESRKLDPKNAEAAVELVRVDNRLAGHAIEKGELAKAQMLLKDAEPLQPDSPYTNRNLGLVYLIGKKCAEAVDPLKKVLAKQPNDIAANRLLGRAYLCVAKRKDATAKYELAAQNALRTRGIELALVWSELGPLYADDGKVDTAITVLEGAVKEAGTSPVAQVAQRNLALVEFQRGLERLRDPKQSEAALNDIKAASQAPKGLFTPKDQAAFACYEAWAAIRAHQIKTAEEAVARAKAGGGCTLKPPYDKLGVGYLELLANYGDSQDPAKRELAAKQASGYVAKSTPAMGENLKALARSALELAAYDFWQKGDEKRADNDLKAAAKVPAKTDRHELDHNLAVIDLFFGRVPAAEKVFQAVVSRVPEALVNLGIIRDRQGDGRGALEQYRRASERGVRSPKLKEWIDVKERLWGSP